MYHLVASKDRGSCFVCLVSIHFSLYRLGKWISVAGKSIQLHKSVLAFQLKYREVMNGTTSLYCRHHNKSQLCNAVRGMIKKKEQRYDLLWIIVQSNATLTMIALTWKGKTMVNLFGCLIHFKEPVLFFLAYIMILETYINRIISDKTTCKWSSPECLNYSPVVKTWLGGF